VNAVRTAANGYVGSTMSEDLHALADAAQAVYFRGHLQQEHADLAIELAHYTKTLTDVVEFRFSV